AEGLMSAMALTITLSSTKTKIYDRSDVLLATAAASAREASPAIHFSGSEISVDLSSMDRSVAEAVDRDKAETLQKGAVEYSTQPVTATGIVATVVFQNPNSYILVADGQKRWIFSLASPKLMTANGWGPTTVHAGDTVTISGFGAADPAALSGGALRAI